MVNLPRHPAFDGIILVPKLTLSEGKFHSPTIDVRGYTGISFRFTSEVENTTLTIYESTDGLIWTDTIVLPLPTNQPSYYELAITKEHYRMVSNSDCEIVMTME